MSSRPTAEVHDVLEGALPGRYLAAYDPDALNGLKTAVDFCQAFTEKRGPDEILSYFSESPEVEAIEHGQPFLAPFLHRHFRGPEGIRQYFGLIASLLSYDDMRFEDFCIDPVAMVVSVRGYAHFTWLSTGNAWDECFTYRLELERTSHKGQASAGASEFKIHKYEIWADSGAAYLAGKGQLKSLSPG